MEEPINSDNPADEIVPPAKMVKILHHSNGMVSVETSFKDRNWVYEMLFQGTNVVNKHYAALDARRKDKNRLINFLRNGKH